MTSLVVGWLVVGCHARAVFCVLTAISRNCNSIIQTFTSDCSAQTDGANRITSSAYKNIAVDILSY